MKKIIKSKNKKPNIENENRVNLLRVGSFNYPQTMNLFEWVDVQPLYYKIKSNKLKKKHSKARYHVKFIGNKMLVQNKLLITLLINY